ncbi:MAG: hypothetical protein FJX62_07230 [Alphaproteobacteria bacterium]|nr:hypothetical protein [Alphaproteobacteria bacterium]
MKYRNSLAVVALVGTLFTAGAALGGAPASAEPTRVGAVPGAGAPDRVSATPGAGTPDRVSARPGKAIRDLRDSSTARSGNLDAQVRVVPKKPTIANPAGYKPRNPDAPVARAVRASTRDGQRVTVRIKNGGR